MNEDEKNKERQEQPPGVGTQPRDEEQMARRQSAPQPTAMDYIAQQRERMLMGQGISEDGAIDGFRVNQPIGREQIQKATLTLNRYKEGKANLERI